MGACLSRLAALAAGAFLVTASTGCATSHRSRFLARPPSGTPTVLLIDIPEENLLKYKRGLTVDGESYSLRKYQYKTPRKVVLTLIEGKNREIRRVFEHFRLKLSRIHRIRIGRVHVRNIPEGGYRMLSRQEISWFLDRDRGR